jgi:hypothetical protein
VCVLPSYFKLLSSVSVKKKYLRDKKSPVCASHRQAIRACAPFLPPFRPPAPASSLLTVCVCVCVVCVCVCVCVFILPAWRLPTVMRPIGAFFFKIYFGKNAGCARAPVALETAPIYIHTMPEIRKRQCAIVLKKKVTALAYGTIHTHTPTPTPTHITHTHTLVLKFIAVANCC